jgi:hypothetical protein
LGIDVPDAAAAAMRRAQPPGGSAQRSRYRRRVDLRLATRKQGCCERPLGSLTAIGQKWQTPLKCPLPAGVQVRLLQR